MKNYLSTTLHNVFGKKLSRKLVVIESDDWGTVRMSSKTAIKELSNQGYPVYQCPYNLNDALEGDDDLTQLFEVLNSVKGSDGKPSILTANNIVANPNFEKIFASDFKNYYYEPFTETLERYPCHNNVMKIYRQGIDERLVKPQFHGREHVHVAHWMTALQNKEKRALDAFDQNMFSVFLGNGTNCNKEFLNSMASYSADELEYLKKSIEEGLTIFSSIWGFQSRTLIAPCYNWHRDLEKTFSVNGIKIIQGGKAQQEPILGLELNKNVRHYNGQKNKFNQNFTVRNVTFEPAIDLNKDWVGSALSDISNAFFWNQPAIISSHRLNYIGWINEENRTHNLKHLKLLLNQIMKKWPDVIFVSSDELINYYNK